MGVFIFKNLTPEGLIDDNVSAQDEFHVQINDPVDKHQTSFIFNHTIDLLIERLLFLARCFCPLLIRSPASADVSSLCSGTFKVERTRYKIYNYVDIFH